MTIHELYDPLTGESLDPDYGRTGGGPSSHEIWSKPLGAPPPPPRRPVPAWRDAELRAMPYSEYLQSPEWQLTRWHVVYRAKGKCERCFWRTRPLQVHHLNYERLGEEDLSDLIALCGHCHRLEHGIEPV